MDRGQNNSEDLDCKSLDCLDHNITGNMNVHDVFAEVSDRKKKIYVIGHQRKDDPCGRELD